MKIRKAILTGGGRATRLFPITTTINKHLLPLANKPMIFHAIEKAVAAGIEEIFINTNPGETELQQYIGDGGHWGIKITFFEQTGGPQGIAHAVNEAQKFIGDEPFMFYLSDNILFGNLKEIIDEFNRGDFDCFLTLSAVPDPERFGVPLFDDSGRLIDVVEKPVKSPSGFAVTGIYLYGPKVFFEAFKRIQKSARGEYEISSIHSDLLKNNKKIGHKEITGWWKDTGKCDDLLVANALLLDNIAAEDFTLSGLADSGAEIGEKTRVGIGTKIGGSVKIIGPVIIAENCVLNNCVIGPYTTIAAGAEIDGGARIENSIVLENCQINCDFYIKDSLIGKKVKISQNGDASKAKKMVVGDKTVLEF
ncbi:MAG: glucose-1-phosphate thymidylyltransferase [Patescibacteria group bacterium]